jgi:hypothetical protein
MVETEEGMDFEGQFRKLFGSQGLAGFAAPEQTQARLKAERRAGLTPKQRAKKSVPKKQINFRATAKTKELIDALAAHLDKSVTDVIALAVESLAQSKLPDVGGTA